MSEEKTERLIPRQSPEVALGSLVLTYQNACVFTFGNGYDFMDHTYVAREDGSSTWVFHNRDLMERLIEEGFALTTMPYPTDSDVRAYEDMQAHTLGIELKALETGEV